jgi:biotin carboxyl carrier protein
MSITRNAVIPSRKRPRKQLDIRAPFSCNVCEISVKEDQEVSEGDNLAVVEAMKMQTPLVSQVSGTVVEIHAKLGQPLKLGDKILKVITEIE